MYRVLVVDDTLDFRRTLKGLLSDEGYAVRGAANEGEALDAVIQESFDFACIDVRLHGDDEEDESGLSLAMALHALDPRIRVILLTRYVRAKQIVRAIRYLGVVDFIEKTPDVGKRVLETIATAQLARGEAKQPRCEEAVIDDYSPYESGLQELLDQLEVDNPCYSDVLIYQHRLIENVTRSRRHGDNDTRKSERSEIVDKLNSIALSELGTSFNDLCRITRPTKREIFESAEFKEATDTTTRLSFSLALNQPLSVRARGHHVFSTHKSKPLEIDIERYMRMAEIARRNPADLRFQIEDIGLNLWRDIFVENPEVTSTYIEARAKSEPLVLLFEAPRDFLRLPLEFLRSATPSEYMILQHPLARFVCGAIPRREALSPQIMARTSELKILLIASNTKPPIDGVDIETQELRDYLQSQDCIPVEVTFLPTERATYERVQTEFKSGGYDVIHYAGHGYHKKDSPEESSLYFWTEENKQGDIVSMKATELKMLLSRSEARLIYLSSCHGTATGGETALLDDDFLGLADAVAQAGVPSVLGFRWPVSDEGASKMALAFYRSLLDKGSPEIALWNARCKLAARDRNDTTWMSPILIHQV